MSDNTRKAYGSKLKEYAKSYEDTGKNAKKAGLEIEGFNKYLVESGEQGISTKSLLGDVTSGIKDLGKTALSIGGNVLLDTAISYGLTAAGKAWDNYSNKQENAIEKGNEALSNYKQTNSTMQEATSWIKDNAERYTELAKGATSLGEQGSLTDAEFKEYNELSAQMATYLPSQIKGYNSLGTAILSVKRAF